MLEPGLFTDLLGSPHLRPPGGWALDEPDIGFVGHVLPLAQFNAVRRVGRPAAGWEATVARVVDAHGGARSRWDLAGADPALESALVAAGYHATLDAAPLGAPAVAISPPTVGPCRVRRCERPVDLHRWVGLFHDARGLAPPAGAPWPLLLRPPSRLYLAECEGRPLGAAGLLVAEPLGVAVLWGASVPAGLTRRGVWSSLVRARAADALAAGVPTLLTQARLDTSAGHLRRLGFRDLGPACTLWERPAVTTSGRSTPGRRPGVTCPAASRPRA